MTSTTLANLLIPIASCLPRQTRARAARAALTALVLCAGRVAWADDTAPAWPVVGQQGLVRFVIVPTERAVDQPAYERQIARLCEPEHTCFLNFYTNTTGAALQLPLPDAVANESTATFRRSAKNGITFFLWSCRLKVPGRECF